MVPRRGSISSFLKTAFYTAREPVESLPDPIPSYKLTTWIPQVVDGDGDSNASKFAGTPWLLQDEQWPRCQHCDEPMPLFLQLNLEALPEALQKTFGSGLLQFFYCTSTEPHCETECRAFFPFSKSQLVRVIHPDSQHSPIENPDIPLSFPPKQIVSWDELDDYPNGEEAEMLGVDLVGSSWEILAERGFPRAGDKLGGWPHWVQGIEYPSCPICGEQMRLIFQLDSNDHLPYMFGDLGCGHITQCLTHKTQVAFGWACS
ncbi:hypothetical protein CSA56_17190 [candidate division KSB3 bacterium]|uniref:DUF1963 domain-containing protein n=1 Tax=candidate division KSB3 bacterium TaxID=2044937 RepID=A0A2G6KAQ5_9BACT|nr:MAG: hypothetical protein CSA56_17190 [candidate division KSB3 bacterium]